MATTPLSPVPDTAAMLSPSGLLTPVWSGWFRQLFNRVGGFSGSSLADGSVTTAKLAALAVTNAKLAASAVAPSNIQSSAVTNAKLAAVAVTYDKILNYRKITGTSISPIAITAIGGITPSGVPDELIYIAGSGAHVTITANPQISAGTNNGDRLTLRVPTGGHGVSLDTGNGISQNGPADIGVDTFAIHYEWDKDASVWFCTGRD